MSCKFSKNLLDIFQAGCIIIRIISGDKIPFQTNLGSKDRSSSNLYLYLFFSLFRWCMHPPQQLHMLTLLHASVRTMFLFNPHATKITHPSRRLSYTTFAVAASKVRGLPRLKPTHPNHFSGRHLQNIFNLAEWIGGSTRTSVHKPHEREMQPQDH